MKKLLPLFLIFVFSSLASGELPEHILVEQNVFYKNLTCLAKNIYFESRGESEQGMIAVGEVTLNRVKDDRFPDDICSVVYQHNQFSWSDHKNIIITDEKSWQKSVNIAYDLLTGKIKNTMIGVLYYHNTKVRPYWSSKMVKFIKIGKHIFYKEKT